MKWLRNKVIKWVREDWANENSKRDSIAIKSIDCENRPEEEPILTFRI